MPSSDSEPNQISKDAPPSGQSASDPSSPPVNDTAQDHPGVSTGYAPRTGKNLVMSAIIVAVVLAGAFLIVQSRRSRQDSELQAAMVASANTAVSVDVVTVKYGSDTKPMPPIDGHVHAWYDAVIYARVSGYVAGWKADIGDRVTKDQVLATIDTPDLDAQFSAAQAKLKVSESNVTVAQAASDFAKTTYDRWWNSPKELVSDQEKEAKKAEYDSGVAQLEAAKSQVSLDQAEVASLKALEDFKSVTAPFDGVITDRHIDFGDLVTAGSTASTTSLYSIAQYDTVRVFVDAPQIVSMDMTVGTSATITTGEYPDRKFLGKIARTSAALDPSARTLKVEVDVPNADLALRPGMFVYVNFDIMQKPLLEVPASALIFRANGQQVAVIDQSGKVSFHNVIIGGDQGDSVEIASGLSPGDRVALNLSSQVSDGDQVITIDADSPSPPSATAAAK